MCVIFKNTAKNGSKKHIYDIDIVTIPYFNISSIINKYLF